MGICLLSWASRTATGDTGEGAKTADEVRAIAVRSISGIKVRITMVMVREEGMTYRLP